MGAGDRPCGCNPRRARPRDRGEHSLWRMMWSLHLAAAPSNSRSVAVNSSPANHARANPSPRPREVAYDAEFLPWFSVEADGIAGVTGSRPLADLCGPLAAGPSASAYWSPCKISNWRWRHARLPRWSLQAARWC
ncbi:hypothetical protein ARTHRO9V_280040 [Arthrobacter sp. 9V]|nr:hypothetical protein ARTHRO9V_280040 [Arthrobacter sp. 9V]